MSQRLNPRDPNPPSHATPPPNKPSAAAPVTPLHPSPADGCAHQLDQFLSQTQARALAIARYALGNPDDALDALQDTMLALAERYSQRPPEQWPPLFYRILSNKITDQQRKRQRHKGLFSWLNPNTKGNGSDDDNPTTAPYDHHPDPNAIEPWRERFRDEFSDHLHQAIQGLPPRQQQTFLLRIWEGLNTAETAQALNISQGSVKTHLSRAMAQLQQQLKQHQ